MSKPAAFFESLETMGSFQWDLMASAANVRRDPMGNRLSYFSRYYDTFTKGVDLFHKKTTQLSQVYCFPPIPIIGMVIKFLLQHQLNCVLILPAVNLPWVNIVFTYMYPRGRPMPDFRTIRPNCVYSYE